VNQHTTPSNYRVAADRRPPLAASLCGTIRVRATAAERWSVGRRPYGEEESELTRFTLDALKAKHLGAEMRPLFEDEEADYHGVLRKLHLRR
jgi:hypothetical protein